MKKLLAAFLIPLLALSAAAPAGRAEEAAPVKLRVLLLPKFETGALTGDAPGEAQYYYEAYCSGGQSYEITGGYPGSRLYVKDGVGLYVTGTGKVNAAASLMAVLLDPRFDFSDAYVISVGCAGSARDTTVMGDVFVITAAVDFDLGHRVDSRELEDSTGTTWFHDAAYDDTACKRLDPDLTDRVWELVKDIPLETTEKTREFMSAAFDGADWAVRDPQVLRGTTVTGDNYWKGESGHANALLMTETYGCPDPYATTEMEDAALAGVMDRMGMLDRFLILRCSVNMDVFMNGATPESLWDPEHGTGALTDENSVEAADIFDTAMRNCYRVADTVVEAILKGKL